MAILPHPRPGMNPAKYSRRTATSVMAGAFDVHPPRDVLTSLLNGVPPYTVVEEDEKARKQRKREKRERERERRKVAKATREKELAMSGSSAPMPQASTSSASAPLPQRKGPSSFWTGRPSIQIATTQRSVSVTPSPSDSPILLPYTPETTPGPSESSSTSRTSSKRPRTPVDGEPFPPAPREKKKRIAVKKGWKGWVEGSPPPSEKLINLDAVPILRERRTRSGKNFDAIGVGKDSWV